MKIESDEVRFLSGVRRGKTLGSPVTVMIENRDFRNWEDDMDPAPGKGLLDAGCLLLARAMRIMPEPSNTFIGICAMSLNGQVPGKRRPASLLAVLPDNNLRLFGIEVASFVLRIGPSEIPEDQLPSLSMPLEELRQKVLLSEVFVRFRTVKRHDRGDSFCKKAGDTLGGILRSGPILFL